MSFDWHEKKTGNFVMTRASLEQYISKGWKYFRHTVIVFFTVSGQVSTFVARHDAFATCGVTIKTFVDMLGSIHSLTLKNFMVYKNCIFRPTSGLNLVIGSNGKSFMCLVVILRALRIRAGQLKWILLTSWRPLVVMLETYLGLV